MSKRVLLTGASGFVGSHILDYLLEKTDWTFVCPCAWKHSGSPERILQLPNYPANKDRVTVVTHDLTAPFSIQTIDQHIDTHVNAGTNTIRCAELRHPDKQINGQLLRPAGVETQQPVLHTGNCQTGGIAMQYGDKDNQRRRAHQGRDQPLFEMVEKFH